MILASVTICHLKGPVLHPLDKISPNFQRLDWIMLRKDR